ncbi:type II toxin-antitoxin system RelE/ParE family toxin [Pseudomonadota bacterium AL_CKDN230030165-1A_HGKHYDSX7]
MDKAICWVGSAYADLLDFPAESRRSAGFQLSRVQAGLEPDDWKPFDEVGPGTREIRIREPAGAFRVMYVAKFEEAVYVLHCFQKKTPTTSLHDKQIAQARYRALANVRKVRP